MLKWFIDVLFTIHKNMKDHTYDGLTMGKGAVFIKNTKQKLNTKVARKPIL